MMLLIMIDDFAKKYVKYLRKVFYFRHKWPHMITHTFRRFNNTIRAKF